MKNAILSEILIAMKQSVRLFLAPFVGAFRETYKVIDEMSDENVARWRRQRPEAAKQEK